MCFLLRFSKWETCNNGIHEDTLNWKHFQKKVQQVAVRGLDLRVFYSKPQGNFTPLWNRPRPPTLQLRTLKHPFICSSTQSSEYCEIKSYHIILGHPFSSTKETIFYISLSLLSNSFQNLKSFTSIINFALGCEGGPDTTSFAFVFIFILYFGGAIKVELIQSLADS